MEGEPKKELKPKLEIQPYSESEIWVALESEGVFETIEEIHSYLRNIAEKISTSFKEAVLARKIFITQAGKQVRISTGSFRDFKPDELEKLKDVVTNLNQ
jgi:hypothetical protein